MRLPRRDLHAEIAKHFKGSAEERIRLALGLGRQALTVFLALQPPGTTLRQAREQLRRNKHRGRHHSTSMEGRGG